jgi:hypothetical protein
MKVSDGLFSYREDVAVQNDKKKFAFDKDEQQEMNNP